MSAVDRIHHVAIQVHNLDEALNWYSSSFNCEVVYQDKREAVLQFENLRLVLCLPSMQQRHVAFVREDAASFGELREQADGMQATMISDPSGNIVKIVTK